jgi:hypothetical protein
VSRQFAFDDHEDYTEAAQIEALLHLRGGRILDAASGVALAMLDDRLVVLRLEGPWSGSYALLSKTGLGRPEQLSDRRFLEWLEGGGGAASARRDQHVVDLSEGVALLLNPPHVALGSVCGTVQLPGVMRHAEKAVKARMGRWWSASIE